MVQRRAILWEVGQKIKNIWAWQEWGARGERNPKKAFRWKLLLDEIFLTSQSVKSFFGWGATGSDGFLEGFGCLARLLGNACGGLEGLCLQGKYLSTFETIQRLFAILDFDRAARLL